MYTFLDTRVLDGQLGLYFTAFLFTMMCDDWVVVCQPSVKRIYDDDDDDDDIATSSCQSLQKLLLLRSS